MSSSGQQKGTHGAQGTKGKGTQGAFGKGKATPGHDTPGTYGLTHGPPFASSTPVSASTPDMVELPENSGIFVAREAYDFNFSVYQTYVKGALKKVSTQQQDTDPMTLGQS